MNSGRNGILKKVFISTFSILLYCCASTELKQEIAIANDNLPISITPGVEARAIELKGDSVIYTIYISQSYYRNNGYRDIKTVADALVSSKALTTMQSSSIERIENYGYKIFYKLIDDYTNYMVSQVNR